ncbi:murein hydrolase effector protein LrgB [Tistrella bauzanensis]|uniref:Murein hydrolase effector protein LrgB n=1 Tax=Tistrella bauzanensis TaxID=657419 RepID=A0ABQ1IE17_9PROT|nr:LrgB family protein [Tistrella bauzanensis]GGB33709.1 murein hydrolase effector protein LrgB [Tistrella bauzanensis]
MTLPDDPATLLFWPAATIGFYIGARALNRLHPAWYTSPLLVTPALLIGLATLLRAGYGDYSRGSHWLTLMIGPATVAFALPIYERRAVIRRHWPVLALGVAIGSSIAMASAWVMADLLGLSDQLARSLMPRSVTMPFAMAVSDDIGGLPDLTAVFVILTGVCGAAIGEVMLNWLPLRSALARGALFGMGAHGAGVAKAHQLGTEEGSIAGLVMVLAGLFNVLMAPVLAAVMSA